MVTVAGIDNEPISPETATFPVNITPEFPIGIAGVLISAVLVGTVVLLARNSKMAFKI